jgi:hypothetical protein
VTILMRCKLDGVSHAVRRGLLCSFLSRLGSVGEALEEPRILNSPKRVMVLSILVVLSRFRSVVQGLFVVGLLKSKIERALEILLSSTSPRR